MFVKIHKIFNLQCDRKISLLMQFVSCFIYGLNERGKIPMRLQAAETKLCLS